LLPGQEDEEEKEEADLLVCCNE